MLSVLVCSPAIIAYLVVITLVCAVFCFRLYQSLKLTEQRYKNTVENALEGIIQTTPDGIFVSANPAFARMLGYESSADLMANVTSIGRQIYVDPNVRLDFLRQLNQNGRARCEYEAWKKDGSTTWLLASSRPVVDARGRVIYYESIVEDISDQRHREETLRTAAQNLAASNERLQRFAHTLAHDLSEPLRTVASYSELLAESYQGKLDARADQFIRYILGGSQRMKQFIDDILAFAQVDWHVLEQKTIDMNALIQDVQNDLKASIQESGAQIEVGTLPRVRGDKVKVHRLLQNLLANAIKFRKTRQPEIKLMGSLEHAQCVFSIQDNGIGFDPEASERIFELFSRLGDRNEHAGSGMGLAMCRQIVEVHGGKIWAKSTPGEGSTFFFTLPSA